MEGKRSVPFFNYPGVFSEYEKEYTGLILDVLHRGAFIQQKDLDTFEKNLARYLGVKHVVGVANCTDALIIALRIAGLKPGDEVILSSHTFVATAAAVHWAGGVPIPADCLSDHMIDPKSVEAAVTPKTRILLPVQVNGRVCKMDALQEIARRNGLILIEDSAQALGARYKGKFAGTFGLAGTFSFYPAKTLNCFGDGGALVTDNDAVAHQARLIRDHGRGADGEITVWGLNSRLDNLQAAILNFKLERYEQDIQRRRTLASFYHQELQGLTELLLPPPPSENSDHFDIFQNYEIEAERRDELRAYLKEYGVGTLVQWGGKPVHQLKALGFNKRLPRTDTLFERCLMLPMNTMLSEDDVTYVCGKIKNFYGHA